MHAFMVSINNAHLVPNAWFLFSPDTLTSAKLSEYKKNAESYAKAGKMQHFSPQRWVGKSMQQTDTLTADELPHHLVEYVLYQQGFGASNSPLGTAMKSQLFPVHNLAYANTKPPAGPRKPHTGTAKPSQGLLPNQASASEAPSALLSKPVLFPPPSNDNAGVAPAERLSNIHHTLLKENGAVFAVHDAIGITQELNNFRNAPLEKVKDFLSIKDQYGADNQRKLEVSSAIEGLEKAFKELHISSRNQWLKAQQGITENRLIEREGHLRYFRNQGRHAEADRIEKEIVETRRAQAASIQRFQQQAQTEVPKQWTNKYLPLLDTEELNTFRSSLSQLSKTQGDIANRRAPDHLAWVKSDRLVDAFDIYDKDHLGSGVGFTHEATGFIQNTGGCCVLAQQNG
jgi:hypothetical protein